MPSFQTAPHPSLGDETTALVIHGAGDLRVEARTLPQLQTDEALVRIAYGGICGSDLHYWLHGAAGEAVVRAPMILGHEVAGTVECLGSSHPDLSPGAPVTVHPAALLPGSGERYPLERPNLAPGCTYLGSAAQTPHTDGAFAQHIVLPIRMLRLLPRHLDLRTASLIEPASVAWHAVARGGDLSGLRVLVIGSGPIGALVIAVARTLGAAEIIATDLHEGALRIASQIGADRTLNAADAAAISAVDADVVFETSGSSRGLVSGAKGATRGGRLVLVGLQAAGEQPAPLALAIARELELIGSFRFNDEIDEVIAALADGRLRIDPVITHEFSLDDAEQAFGIAADPSTSSKVLLDFT